MRDLSYRQIHLDFHTSPHIEGVGAGFDENDFQMALRAARASSVTLFAVCHHGWHYTDTAVGAPHPHLHGDLLGRQIKAARTIGVRAPIYVTAGLNDRAAALHPEWREVDPEGRPAGGISDPALPGFTKLCFGTGYLDFLCAELEELVARFPDHDGIFLDIVMQGPCACDACREGMRSAGLDASKPHDRSEWAERVLAEYYRRTDEAVRRTRPDAGLIHNSGHVSPRRRPLLRHFSHLELESLPTGGWGYDHFPMTAAWARTLGLSFLGMTGKFHTTWGEFGGFKHPNALRYECALMLAVGARCSVGDQLHPSGRYDESTAGLIGAAYAEVEAKEPWVRGAVPVADVAVLSCESTGTAGGGHSNVHPGDAGAARLLLEAHLLFDFTDPDADWSKYRALILPDEVRLNPALAAKLDAWRRNGGKLVLSGKSGLRADADGYALDVGAEHLGSPSATDANGTLTPDYLAADPAFAPDWIATPVVMHLPAETIRVVRGRALGEVQPAWFPRTFEHYSSHQHAPNRPDAPRKSAGRIGDDVLLFAHPVFSLYRTTGAVALRHYVTKALRAFLGAPSVEADLPSDGRLFAADQKDPQSGAARRVAHLLYAPRSLRGGAMDVLVAKLHGVEVIEELPPLRKVTVTSRGFKAARATLEPGGRALAIETLADGAARVTIDEFSCHQMAVFHAD